MGLKAIMKVSAILVLVLALAGCAPTEREYHADIVIALQDPSELLVIKEWSFLLGSGAEVYYQKDGAEPVLLGKTTGGDDGFCPFIEGLYEITQDGDALTVRWCFQPSDKDKTHWHSKTFDLSLNENG